MLDYTQTAKPTMSVKMRDNGGTVLRITPPPLDVVEELTAMGDVLAAAAADGTSDAVTELYNFASRVLSCNRDHITVAPEDITGKYDLDVDDLTVFFSDYVDFITGISRRKN